MKGMYENGEKQVPVIPNIHQTILDAVSKPGALNMGEWHTCDTTHCRAGWVVHLAGQAGYELENACTTADAALIIYAASAPDITVLRGRFYDGNEAAMQDMINCAEAEKAAQQ